MYTTLKERIEGILNNPNADEDDKIYLIIHHIIKPIAKEAFEAGLDGNVRSKDRESFINEWINENLK